MKNNQDQEEKAFQRLAGQLKEAGFGDELRIPLRTAMMKGEPNFSLQYAAPFDSNTQVTLKFTQGDAKKGPQLEHYVMATKSAGIPYAEQQHFQVHENKVKMSVTEAYNLMNNRAVSKELEMPDRKMAKVWMQLNFKETDAKGNYLLKEYGPGFDLEAALARHPIRELENRLQKQIVMQSLEEGNRQAVTLGSTKVFVEAAPQFKSLNFYDEHQQRIRPDQVKAIANSQQMAGTNESIKPDTSKQQARGQGI